APAGRADRGRRADRGGGLVAPGKYPGRVYSTGKFARIARTAATAARYGAEAVPPGRVANRSITRYSAASLPAAAVTAARWSWCAWVRFAPGVVPYHSVSAVAVVSSPVVRSTANQPAWSISSRATRSTCGSRHNAGSRRSDPFHRLRLAAAVSP